MTRKLSSPGCRSSVVLLCLLLYPGAASDAAGQSNGDDNGGAPATTSLEAFQMADDETAPVVDGLVNEEIWQRAPAASGFIQQDPLEGQPATERTEVRILFDRRTLYLSFICFDSQPGQIVVTESRRDAGLNETDSIQVLIDTFNDGQNAFVFGTNPLGIEYDGQVAGEGQTGGVSARGGGGGSQRGQISGFNANWDGDWTVRARITERGWEAEMGIPLRTLRYVSGPDRTWGFNVMRNIRRKNEQVFLVPIPRGYNLYRVSMAADLPGLDLPGRRDIKAIPFVAASLNKDYVSQADVDRTGDIGLDVKWGVRPNLTLDLTVNTDFAQVEADEEQINLTRFALFFPEKRPFFLENASMFQFGSPQEVDLFFSRRIGLSARGEPIDLLGGARLTGKIGSYNVAMLNMQTNEALRPNGDVIAPGNNFSVMRVQREVGRSNFGGIVVSRQGTGDLAGADNYNRAYGLDAALQLTPNGKLFTFFARTDSPGETGSDYAGRAIFQYANQLWNGFIGYTQVGEQFNPEVGFVPRRGFRKPEGRFFLNYQPKRWSWIRRISPHITQSAHYGLEGELQSSRGHYHFFEIQPARGGRFGFFVNRDQDRPVVPFRVFSSTDGREVVIPPALYTWNQFAGEYFSDQSAPVFGSIRWFTGGFYNGDFQGLSVNVGGRLGARFRATVGWSRDDVDLPQGAFTTDLIPINVSYSFTTLASLQALLQYNSQAAQFSSNVRLALLDRSGTGLFLVYNERRDTTRFNPEDLLGRSFIVKYTRLFDF